MRSAITACLVALFVLTMPVLAAQSNKPHILDPNQMARASILDFKIKKTSGYIPPECDPDDPLLLDCWLDQHYYTVAAVIDWEVRLRDNSIKILTWYYWEPWRKDALRQAWSDARQWYKNGLTNYPGVLTPEPPPNEEAPWIQQGLGHHTVLSEANAWQIYVATVGMSLAAEIDGWFNWSLRDYDSNALFYTLSSRATFRLNRNNDVDSYNSNADGYIVMHAATPAHPTVIFKFLADNNLIGVTPTQTVGHVLNWARWNLAHFFGPHTVDQWFLYWQYLGKPPVSRVIEGTVTTDPGTAPGFPGKVHWTAGCYGTTDFITRLLRLVNIPIHRVGSFQETGGHTSPYFVALQQYMSHGDDPYTSLSKANFPGQLLLIGENTWTSWFQNADPLVNLSNVGRRPVELAVWYLGDFMVGEYCGDVWAGKDHATGDVYSHYSTHYTVAQLEATDLWGRLQAKAVTSALPICAFLNLP